MENQKKINELIKSIVEDSNVQLNNTTELLESGILDSLGIAQLVAAIETEFNIELDGDDIIPENFDTINAINALINKYYCK